MKKIRVISVIIIFLLMMIGCVKITDTQSGTVSLNKNGEYPILFSNQTKAQINSVSGTGYDEFKLFTWNSLGDTIMKPYTVAAYGVGDYRYEELPGQELKYFNKSSNWHDFIGVIPVDHEMKLKNGSVKIDGVKSFIVDDKRAEQTINLTDTLYWSSGLTEESPEEFLTVYKRVLKNEYGSTVELPFKHENAIIFISFSSDKTDTQIIDYVPEQAEVPGVAGTITTENAKMFDLLAQGKLVGYYFDSYQEANGGIYAGQEGNFFNLNPYHGGYNYVSKDRLAKLMPLVNAQFIYCDQNCNAVDKWEYGVNKKDKMFIKFADGIDGAEFIAGNDAFWNNLTDEEKTKMQVYKNSGCRVIRIDKLSDGEYFAWGESYGTNWAGNTSRNFKVINGGTIGKAAIPCLNGIRVFSADSLGLNNLPTDTLYCVHRAHTITANATISATGCVLSDRIVKNDVIQYSLPETTTLSSTAVWSPTTFYALPGDENFNYLVVKLSYTYNGDTIYDVRVPIKLPDGGLKAGKYYKYQLHITSLGNGTVDPYEAMDEKDEVLIEKNSVITVNMVDFGYTIGASKKITI